MEAERGESRESDHVVQEIKNGNSLVAISIGNVMHGSNVQPLPE